MYEYKLHEQGRDENIYTNKPTLELMHDNFIVLITYATSAG